MKNIIINSSSINTFKERIIKENNKLLDIINDMYEDSLKYQDMVDNKAGNLYKEVMLKELTKEKEQIINNNDVIDKTFTDIIGLYDDVNQSNTSSVEV